MLGPWKIGVQLSTSHSSRIALDPSEMLETVHRAREAIDLDLLIVGFREAPEVFREFYGESRPIDEVYLWYTALSDIDEMEDSDLVVNWRGEPSRGWEAGRKVEARSRKRFVSSAPTTRRCVRRLAVVCASSSSDMNLSAYFSTRSASLHPPTAQMKSSPASATTVGAQRRQSISTSIWSSRLSPITASITAPG
jgi:hypothetical protein